jgi:hypothetical protein
MEEENKTKQDCGCDAGSDCCPPPKNKLWMKIVFIVIIAAAAAIVTVKLVNKSNAPVNTGKSSCGDSTKGCDPAKNPGCCSKDTAK